MSSLEGARRLPSEIIIQANAQQVTNSPIGSFTYRPVVDGVIVPDAPATMMKQGRLDHGVSVMLGYNGNDGVIFSDFSLTNDTEYRDYVSGLLNLTPNQTDYLATSIYPPVSESSEYVDEISRAATTFQEAVIQCNDIFLATAMGNSSFNYVYDVFPSLHAMDLQATFDISPSHQSSEFDSSIALQQLITSFVLTGNPASSSHGKLPTYGPNGMLSVINATTIYNERESQDAVARCNRLYELMYSQ